MQNENTSTNPETWEDHQGAASTAISGTPVSAPVLPTSDDELPPPTTTSTEETTQLLRLEQPQSSSEEASGAAAVSGPTVISATANYVLTRKERTSRAEDRSPGVQQVESVPVQQVESEPTISATANYVLARKERTTRAEEGRGSGVQQVQVESESEPTISHATANYVLARKERTNRAEGRSGEHGVPQVESVTHRGAAEASQKFDSTSDPGDATTEIGSSQSSSIKNSFREDRLDGITLEVEQEQPGIDFTQPASESESTEAPQGHQLQVVESVSRANQGLAVAAPVEEEQLGVAERFDAEGPLPKDRKRQFRLAALVILLLGACAAVIAGTTVSTRAQTNSGNASSSKIVYNRAELGRLLSPESIAASPDAFESALEWFSNQDPVQLEPDDPRYVQRFVLVWFWFHSTNNGIDSWNSCNPPDLQKGEDDSCVFKSITEIHEDGSGNFDDVDSIRWLTGTHECDWPGISCDENATVVKQLELRSTGLHGEFPLFLHELKAMDVLTFSHHKNLVGTLPSAVSYLQQLTSLIIVNTALGGQIPESTYSMTNLEELNLSWNQFTGTLSPDIGQMKSLVGLFLFDNRFHGSIPESFGNLTNLEYFRLNKCGLSGTIPKSFAKLTKLKRLYLFDNELEGSIPEEFSSLVSIEEFRLFQNQLSGPLPKSLPWPNATRIFLQENRLNGTISDDFYQMSELNFLHFGDNEFTGFLDPQIGNLTNLAALSFEGNSLTGTIPSEIATMTNLRILVLKDNMLNGTIPSELALLTSLRALGLHYNQFEGDVPVEICSNPDWEDLLADCAGLSNDTVNSCSCCTKCCDRVNRTADTCDEDT